MATVTSLGFNVFSRYDGTGIRRAQADLRRLNNNQQVMTEGATRMTRAVALFGPVAIASFGGAAAAAAKASVSLGAAAAGTALWGLAMKNFIAKNAGAQKEVARLKSAIDNFGLSASRVLGQTLTTAVNAGITVLRKLEPVVRAVSPVFLKIAQDINKFANGPGMTKLSNWLSVAAPAAIAALWQATKNLGSGLVTLATRLGLFNDKGRAFNVWIVKVTENFKKWANGPEIPKLRAFLAEAWPLVGQLAINFLKLAKAVIVALGPLGLLLLKLLVPIVGWLAKMAEEHPKVVQAMYMLYLTNKLLNVVLLIYKSAIIQLIIHLVRFAAAMVVNVARMVAMRVAMMANVVATRLAAAAHALLNGALLRTAVLWVMNTARMVAHRVAMVATRVATALMAAANALLNVSLLRTAALWLLNAARQVMYRAGLIATRVATALLTAAQTIFNVAFLRTAALWLLNAARQVVYRTGMVATRVATMLLTAATTVFNVTFLRTAALWLLNAARQVVYRTGLVITRTATALLTAATTVFNVTFLRTAALWLLNAARQVVYRTGLIITRGATLLLTAATTLFNATFLRTAALWLLNATRQAAYRAALIVTRGATLLMTAAQNLLSASLLRSAGLWLLNAARTAAYRTALAVSRAAAVLMTAAQNLLNASLLRGAAAWLLNAARSIAYRTALVASRVAAALMTTAQNLLNLALLRGAAAWLINAARAVAYRVAMVASRVAAMMMVAAQNLLNIALIRGAAAWLLNAARAAAYRVAMLASRAATLLMAAAQAILNTALIRGAALWVAYVAKVVIGRGIMLAVRIATLAWAAAQAVLNAVLLANPIVLIIVAIIALVAAIVIAYRESETFRKIVHAAFRIVTAAAVAMWTNMKAIFGFMVSGFQAVGRACVTAWNFMWNAIRNIFNISWGAIRSSFTAMFRTMVSIFQAIGRGIGVAWEAVWSFVRRIFNISWGAIRDSFMAMFRTMVSIFQAIGRGIGTAWNAMWSFVRRIFNASWSAIRGTAEVVFRTLVRIFQMIGRGVGTAWQAMWSFVRRIFNAAWSAIRTTAEVVFRTLVRIFQMIGRGVGTAWQAMWSFVRRIFNIAWGAIRGTAMVVFRTLVSIFQAIGRGVGTAWNAMWSFVRRVFNGAWNALEGSMRVMANVMADIWRGIVNTAKSIWNGIKKVVAVPINFVIGFVADNLIPFVNKALSLVLGDKAPKINGGALKGFKIKGFANGGVVGGYAGGGVLPGYSPGRDNMIGSYKGNPIGLSGGEGILRPEVVRSRGVREWLYAANKKARMGGKGAVENMMGFARGGVIGGGTVTSFEIANGMAKLGAVPGGGEDMRDWAGPGFFFGGIIDDALDALTGVGRKIFDFGKDLIMEKGFGKILQKALGPMFDNALEWVKGFGPIGEMLQGVLIKVVKSIVEWAAGKMGGGSASSVVKAAQGYIGQGDNGGNNVNNQFNKDWGMGDGTPWCANFVSTCIRDANAEKFYPGFPTAAVYGYWSKMKHVSRNSAQPGDLRTTGSSTHINIIEKNDNGRWTTIGGNEGPKVRRSQNYQTGTILRPKAGAPGGGGSGGGGGKQGLLEQWGNSGGMGGGGPAWFTSYWDNAGNVGVMGSTGAQASGRPMSINSAASSYLPLFSRIMVGIGGKTAQATIEDLGPSKFVYDRHPGMAVIDINKLLMGRLTGSQWNSVAGKWKMLKVGHGRTLYGKRLRGYEGGGHMSAGEMALVGERGPEVYQSGRSGGQVYTSGTSVSSHGDTHVHFNDKVFVKNEREFQKMVVTAIEEAHRKKKF